jgi:hypothetical protein
VTLLEPFQIAVPKQTSLTCADGFQSADGPNRGSRRSSTGASQSEAATSEPGNNRSCSFPKFAPHPVPTQSMDEQLHLGACSAEARDQISTTLANPSRPDKN